LVAVKIGGVMFRLADVEAFEESRATGKPKKGRRRTATVEVENDGFLRLGK